MNHEEEKLESLWSDAWEPPDRRPPWLWAEEHVPGFSYSPVPGAFRADYSPWIKEPLEALVDVDVKTVVVMASVQGGKTTILELGSAYIICNMPGPLLWLDNTDVEAKDQAESRLTKLYDTIEAVKALYPANRHAIKTSTKHFSNGMTMWVLGGANPSNLNRRSIRWLFCDEVWQWPKGHVKMAEARCTAFGWLGKTLLTSQAGHEGDDLCEKWAETDQRIWTFACPECQHRQPYLWENIHWSKDAVKETGWDVSRVRETATLACANCGTHFPDTDRQRRILNKSGAYVASNREASKAKVGFLWNAIATRSWGDLAEEYLIAKAEARRGEIENLKVFYMKRLAIPWSDNCEDFKLELKPSDFSLGDPWGQEGGLNIVRTSRGHQNILVDPPFAKEPALRLRIMTVDCQMDHFWVLVRFWTARGDSRLIWWEKVTTWGAVAELQEKYDIHSSLVFVDAGYASYQVYEECSKRGWTALRGDQKPFYVHTVKVEGKADQHPRRFYSPKRPIEIRRGVSCDQFYWSNLNIKDMLARLMRGQSAIKWEAPHDVGDEYQTQMTSERRVQKGGSWIWERIGKRDNHLWDCEAMQIAAAHMLKLIGRESVNLGGVDNEKDT